MTPASTSSRAIAFVGGRLVPSERGADSILIVGERISNVGSARDVLANAPREVDTIELGGRIVTPGFQDGHMHFLSMGVRATRPSLGGARSLDEALAIVRAAAQSGAAEVLVAEGWDETKWRLPETPHRAAIDRIAADRPIVMRRVCGHAAVANHAALQWLATRWNGTGIDRESGMLLEHPALSLDSMLAPTALEADGAIDEAARLCLERGITACCDFLRPGDAAAWARRLSRGELPLTIHGYLVEADSESDGLAEIARGRNTFVLQGTKIFTDGSIGARTAALGAPYADRPESTGALLLDSHAISGWIERANARRASLAVHAIGDRAIGAVLDAFSRFDPEECRARRHRIEHLELPRPGDPERLAALGVRPCMQPNFMEEWGRPGGLYERALGPARVRRMNPLRSVHEAACGLFFGSDGMPLSSIYGVRAAMTHPVESERLEEDDAVRLSTSAVAEAFGADSTSGRLVPGAAADLSVLAKGFDWTTADSETRTDLTLVAGRVVHRRAAQGSAELDRAPARGISS
jgi:predicted amidohydrolase YtcJ